MSVKDAEDTKIQDFVVLPEVISSSEQIEPHVAIKQITDFIRQKTHESEKVSGLFGIKLWKSPNYAINDMRQ
jgi:hypothetical protein